MTILSAGTRAAHLSQRVEPLFHGTKRPWFNHMLQDIGSGNIGENMFGPGLYMTDTKAVAETYMDKSPEGMTYQLRWKQDPNLINLEERLSPDVLNTVGMHLRGPERNRALAQAAPQPGYRAYNFLTRGLQPGQKVGIARQLREMGYHGFRHPGGESMFGDIKHNVNISFAPDRDLQVVHATRSNYAKDTINAIAIHGLHGTK